jgi:hypothetical protein
MKHLPVLLLLAISGCAEHHDLSTCGGPYSALSPPPLAELPKAAPGASPASLAKPTQQPMVDAPDATTRGVLE